MNIQNHFNNLIASEPNVDRKNSLEQLKIETIELDAKASHFQRLKAEREKKYRGLAVIQNKSCALKNWAKCVVNMVNKKEIKKW